MRSETACAQAHRQPRRFMQRPAAPTAPARGRAYLALRQQLGAGHHLLLAAARAHGRQQHARLALRRLPKKSAGVGALGLELGFTVTMPIGKSRRPTSLLSQQRVKSPSAPVTTQRGDWGLSRHPPVRRGERGRWGGRAARGGGGGAGPRPAGAPRLLLAAVADGPGVDRLGPRLALQLHCRGPSAHMHRCCALLSDALCSRRGLSDVPGRSASRWGRRDPSHLSTRQQRTQRPAMTATSLRSAAESPQQRKRIVVGTG